MDFGSWDSSIHDDPEQIKRLNSAKKSDVTPISADKENKSAIFAGSGKSPYETTLDTCTCRDYFVRKLPCKHIYRLAMEMKLAKETFDIGVNKNVYIKSIPEIPSDCQKALYDMIKFMIEKQKNYIIVNRSPAYDRLVELGYCDISKLTLHEAAKPFKTDYLRSVFHEIMPKVNSSKETILKCIEKRDAEFLKEKYMILNLSEAAEHGRKKIHKELKLIFEPLNVDSQTE